MLGAPFRRRAFAIRLTAGQKKQVCFMSEQIDCVVAGHICLDVAPKMFPAGSTPGEVFRPGRIINVGEVTISTGGAVSNTGLPLRRLGMNVELMGKCGDDTFGRILVQIIQAEAPGAEKGMKIAPGEHTGYTIAMAPPGIDRIFLHCPGANDTFGPEDVDLGAVRRARLFHIGYPPVMARLYGEQGAQLKRILADVRDAGVTTSLDMAYPDPDGPAGKIDWAAVLENVLPGVDIFAPSVEELTFMLRRRTFERLIAAADGGEVLAGIDGQLLSDLAEQCIGAGAGVVVIKCGYLGLYIRTAGRGRLERFGRAACTTIDNWADRELFEPSYRVERVVSATGAGDCAIAGFLAAFVRGCDVQSTVRYACAAGAQNLRALDAVSGIAGWDETTRQIESRPRKVDPDIMLAGWKWDDAQDHYVGPRDGTI